MIEDARIFPDVHLLSQAAAHESVSVIEAAAREKGLCSICLSGGTTPAKLYTLWATAYRDKLPWNQIHFFWGDERYVSPENSLSNYRMALGTMLCLLPIPAQNVHRMPTTLPLPEDAAEKYEAVLREFFGKQPPAFDLLLLGVGEEGHTASLFPGSPALNENKRWVVPVRVPAEPPQRLTLTLPVLNRSRNVFFLVAGANKRQVIEALRKEPAESVSAYPAGRIRPQGRLTWLLDQAAAGS